MRFSIAAIAIAITSSLLTSSVYAGEITCCSSHGGIRSCNVNVERLQCADGSIAPLCVCSSKTRIDKRPALLPSRLKGATAGGAAVIVAPPKAAKKSTKKSKKKSAASKKGTPPKKAAPQSVAAEKKPKEKP